MGELLFVLIIMILLGIIIAAGRIKIIMKGKNKNLNKYVKTMDDKAKQKSFEEMLSNVENVETSFTDEEFEMVKKAYGSTTGSAIGIPLIATVCVVLITWLIWQDLEMGHKVMLVVALLLSWIICIIGIKKSKSVFESDRNMFRKKTAYVFKTEEAKLYGVNRNDVVKQMGTAEFVIVAVLDRMGKSRIYKVQTSPEVYVMAKNSGKCCAIMYKGEFSNLVAISMDEN